MDNGVYTIKIGDHEFTYDTGKTDSFYVGVVLRHQNEAPAEMFKDFWIMQYKEA